MGADEQRQGTRIGALLAFLQSASAARLVAFVGASTQLVAFIIKIGFELTWRPVAMIVELAVCLALVVAAFRSRRSWPLVLIAVWQLMLAGMIWIASFDFWSDDCLNGLGCQGFDGWAKTASFAVFGGAVLLVASASVLWQIRQAEAARPKPKSQPFGH